MARGTRDLRQYSHKPFYLFSVKQICSFLCFFFFLEMQACLAHNLRLLVCTNSVSGCLPWIHQLALIKSPIKRILCWAGLSLPCSRTGWGLADFFFLWDRESPLKDIQKYAVRGKCGLQERQSSSSIPKKLLERGIEYLNYVASMYGLWICNWPCNEQRGWPKWFPESPKFCFIIWWFCRF